jgi:C1A family cysteine protease
MKTSKIIFLLSWGLLVLVGCKKEEPNKTNTPEDKEFSTGLADGGTGATTPISVGSLGTVGSSNKTLPSRIDLTPFLPPVGDQGSKGTCAAWAVGYNAKTAANAINKGLTTSQIISNTNHFSPLDIFAALPNNKRGVALGGSDDCDGTHIETVCATMQQRGIATMQVAPYELYVGRGCVLQSSWTNNAVQNKIRSYRRINPSLSSVSIDAIKTALSNGSVVVFGANLPDGFGNWNGNLVMKGLPASNKNGHAMAIVGYDDSKRAFRIVNSWGMDWADRGFCWVDYDYFTKTFVNPYWGLFILEEPKINITPTPNPTSGSADLVPWIEKDVPLTTSGTAKRNMTYNVYNTGNVAVGSNPPWYYAFFYYNAYNLDDYDIIFIDGVHYDAPTNSFKYDSDIEGWVINKTIPAGSNFSQVVYGSKTFDKEYAMPRITGDYYLVMYVDPLENVKENNRNNNIFYTTDNPKKFVNGFSGRSESAAEELTFKNNKSATEQNLKSNEHQSAVNANNLNAYTPEEVQTFFASEKANGNLDRKIKAHLQRKGLIAEPKKGE